LKGMETELISKLTDMRSSGIAELPKIEKRRTHARTRLIALSNPRSGRPLASYNHGILAIKELIFNLEDIRRFDLALLVSSEDVSAAEISRLQIESVAVTPKYLSELCRQLVLWAWTVSNVEFEDEDYIAKQAIELTTKYHDSIPLVDRGTMRHKLARLASALAARLYSTTDYTALQVKNYHVDYIYQYLDRMYSSTIFNYHEYSEVQEDYESFVDEDKVRSIISSLPSPDTFIRFVIRNPGFDTQDMMEWTGLEKETVFRFISALIQQMAVKRAANRYYLSASFIKLARSMMVKKDYGDDTPEYLREDY
jgi:hypothetical protein